MYPASEHEGRAGLWVSDCCKDADGEKKTCPDNRSTPVQDNALIDGK